MSVTPPARIERGCPPDDPYHRHRWATRHVTYLRGCDAPGCDATGPIRRGWCAKHYRRWRLYGDPLGSPSLLPPLTPSQIAAECWAAYRRLAEALGA
ncbi:MAG: hypothetical protein GEV07_22090 [Streptosporangiales bacterium]|nr:hypothetical protein [Streptosporangiales bacterium]